MPTNTGAVRLETAVLRMHGCTRALRRSALLCCGVQQQAARCNDIMHRDVTGMCVVQTLAPATQLGPLGYLAGASFLVGFVWETVADLQKFHFKSQNPDKCAPCPQIDPLRVSAWRDIISPHVYPSVSHYPGQPVQLCV